MQNPIDTFRPPAEKFQGSPCFARKTSELNKDTLLEVIKHLLLDGYKTTVAMLMITSRGDPPNKAHLSQLQEPIVFLVKVEDLISSFKTGSTLYEITVDWGDGQTEIVKSLKIVSHIYPSNGVYRIRVFVAHGFNNIQFDDTLHSVLTIGKITSCEYTFSDLKYFNEKITIDTSLVTNMRGMFFGAIRFNQKLKFDTSLVTDMRDMFYGAKRFNQELKLNTSLVTNMSRMFYGAKRFNQELKFDTSLVTDMSCMLCRAINFNQELKFDTSLVANMWGMFYRAENFNQELKFDTSLVTDMSYMFCGATAFNQKLEWNIASVRNMNLMFYKASSFDRKRLDWEIPSATDTHSMFDSMQGDECSC